MLWNAQAWLGRLRAVIDLEWDCMVCIAGSAASNGMTLLQALSSHLSSGDDNSST